MNSQRELSTQILKQNNKKIANYKQKQQLILKKQKKVNGLKKEKLPNSFVDVLNRIDKAKNHALVINSLNDSVEYHTAEKLTNLYWIRAIKNHKGLITFQETKIGKKVMKDVKPKIYKKKADYSLIGADIALVQTIFGGSISLLSFFDLLSSIFRFIGMAIMLLAFGVLAAYSYFDGVKTKDIESKNKYLTPFNSIKSVKPLLNTIDAKCEFKLLIKYSK